MGILPASHIQIEYATAYQGARRSHYNMFFKNWDALNNYEQTNWMPYAFLKVVKGKNYFPTKIQLSLFKG